MLLELALIVLAVVDIPDEVFFADALVFWLILLFLALFFMSAPPRSLVCGTEFSITHSGESMTGSFM